MDELSPRGQDYKFHHLTLTGVGYFLDGYNLNSIAVFTFLLLQERFFRYNAIQIGLVSGVALLGAAAGSLLLGRVSDVFGRRRAYFLYPIFFIVFPLASALSWNITIMTIFRFLLGMGIGADYAVGPVYSIEMLPDSSRGTGYGYVWAFWSLGSASAFFAGLGFIHFAGPEAWRYTMGLSSLPAVLLIALRRNAPETSRWAALTSADQIGSEKHKQQNGANPNSLRSEVSPLEIFKGNLAYRTMIVWTQWILLDIGSYGFNLYTPIIVSQIGYGQNTSILITGILYVFGFLAALLSMSWNDKFGRKTIQEIGFGLMAVGMLVILISYSIKSSFSLTLGFTGLIFWFAFENIGPGNTMGLYAMELFPTKLRSTSMGAATAITRFVSFLSAFEFPLLVLTVGRDGFFILMTAVMATAFVFTIVLTPETRGITLEQVENFRLKRGKLIP